MVRFPFPIVLLFDRQRVHIGAHQNHRPVSIAQNAFDASHAQTFLHFNIQFAQARGDNARRAFFFVAQFGMRMKIAAQRDNILLPRQLQRWFGVTLTQFAERIGGGSWRRLKLK